VRQQSLKRPLPHHFLIASYIATPVVNVVLISIFLRVPLPGAAERILAGYGPVVAAWLATAPVAGAFLYLLRRASWYVFLVHACIIIAGSVLSLGLHIFGDVSIIPRAPQAVFLAGNVLRILFVGYVLQKDFRAPYLQILKRSFRSSRRLPIRRPILIDGEACRTGDLSSGGCYVAQAGARRRVGERLRVRLEGRDGAVECAGQIMRSAETGFGIRFSGLTRRDRRALRLMMAQPATGPARSGR
jgi:hypothetical protein